MRVLAAVDKFKGSLTASEVAAHLGLGLRAAQPGVEVVELPIADGGEGTLEAAEAAGYRRRTLTVAGPTGEPLQASLALSGRTAVVEMAAASGLALLPHGQRHPLTATSRGTGELVRAALDEGCETIVLGVGGSACTDGGAGLLQALGLSITDRAGLEVGPGGAALRLADRVDATGLDPRLAGTTVVLASDVDNPLTGVHGAPAVYGPQKGATPEDVAVLEAGLTRWVAVLADALGPQVRDAARSPGAGAAGGLGFAAVAALNGTFRPGIDVVLELTGFHRHLVGADLVITGEGSLDAQSLHGKAPVGVASAAAGAAVPVVAVAGVVQISDEALAGVGIRRAYALTDLEPDLDRCIREAGPLLEELAQRVARDWLTPSGRGDRPPRREPLRNQPEAET
jgi:glycerate kinase